MSSNFRFGEGITVRILTRRKEYVVSPCRTLKSNQIHEQNPLHRLYDADIIDLGVTVGNILVCENCLPVNYLRGTQKTFIAGRARYWSSRGG